MCFGLGRNDPHANERNFATLECNHCPEACSFVLAARTGAPEWLRFYLEFCFSWKCATGVSLVICGLRFDPYALNISLRFSTLTLRYLASAISSTSHSSSASRKRCDTEGLYLDDVLSLEPSEANIYLQVCLLLSAGIVFVKAQPLTAWRTNPPEQLEQQFVIIAVG